MCVERHARPELRREWVSVSDPNPIVQEADQRNKRDGTCFYCGEAVGTQHKDECVLVTKRVKLRLTAVFETECPRSWDHSMIAFHFGENNCADNMLRDLARYAERRSDEGSCMCDLVEVEEVLDE